MENLPSIIIHYSIVSFVVGIIVGTVFDVLNFCYRDILILNNKFFIFITDILKWVFFIVTLILLFYYLNDGRSRGIYFVSILFGLLLYRLAVSRFIIKILEITFYPIKKAVIILLKIMNKIHNFFAQAIAKAEERLYNKGVE